jgi:hypothetical protein
MFRVKLSVCLLILGACGLALAPAVQAGIITPSLAITADEYGNGSAVLTLPSGTTTYSEAGLDLTPGVEYYADEIFPADPTPFTSGVVKLTEPETGKVGDFIVFTPNTFTFYSLLDPTDSPPAPADMGADQFWPLLKEELALFPSSPVPRVSEASLYTPTSGQPGYIAAVAEAGGVTTYNFISDVPEPSTIAIWSLLGAVGLAVAAWRRK